MRYLILIISLTGGFVSFNSYAASCPVGATVPAGTYKPYYIVNHDGIPNLFINVGGCEYLADSPFWTPEGLVSSSSPFVSTGKPAKEGVSPSVDENGKNPAPELDDKPDVTPPVIDVKPPQPDKPKPPAGSYVSQQLASISQLSPAMLYSSFMFSYSYSATPDDNLRLAQAFLSKLSDVTPSSYYEVDRVKDMMNNWQHDYNVITHKDHILDSWDSSRFVGGEHRYLGYIRLPVDSCTRPVTVSDSDGSTHTENQVFHNCSDEYKNFDINDPDYASESDYKNGVTRCMRDPSSSSCHSSGDSSGSSGDTSGGHTVTLCAVGLHPDPSRPGDCLPDSSGGGGSSPDTGDKPDNCPSGSHHEPGTMEGSCTTDLTPNPGTGGGSGSGSTDNNDNGDVVAAINAFHADNNKNHKELMDDLNKKLVPPDYTGMEGDFSSLVGGAMSGITDSVKSAWDAGKTAFGEGLSGIDSMLPDIKTSFDLPPGFEAASLGRCIPVVLDFDIKLVGIPDYHFHAVGTQVCLLYDKYIRPVLNFVMVMLSFFVIHRLLIRSAEFLTDGRN
ncbi:TPA: hypothetical protein G9F28_001705 [Salmonella enterica]|nr:hypothetical protein [Salmonella enterica]